MKRRVQNFNLLATDALRLDALSIAKTGYAAIDAAASELLRNDHYELLG